MSRCTIDKKNPIWESSYVALIRGLRLKCCPKLASGIYRNHWPVLGSSLWRCKTRSGSMMKTRFAAVRSCPKRANDCGYTHLRQDRICLLDRLVSYSQKYFAFVMESVLQWYCISNFTYVCNMTFMQIGGIIS
jgi:hypothetical protein